MLKHQHIIIRAEITNPPKETDVDFMNNWFKELIHDINMKILMGPYTVYSHMEKNRGFTGVCVIETSHICIHVWDEESPAVCQIDVYTCADLDIQKVFNKIKPFNPVKVEYHFLDRDDDLEIVDRGFFQISP